MGVYPTRQSIPRRVAAQADYFDDIYTAIRQAREIQEFIWDNQSISQETFDQKKWHRLFQKRVDAISELDLNNPGAIVLLRKRLLQQAALSIKALEVLHRRGIKVEENN